jgi:hypothetical protein
MREEAVESLRQALNLIDKGKLPNMLISCPNNVMTRRAVVVQMMQETPS